MAWKHADVRDEQSAPARAESAAPMLESLENRQYMAAVVIEDKIKVRNVSANNLSTNQSVLTIPFSEAVTLADASHIRIRGYATDPITLSQKKLIIRITDAQQVDSNHITLTTDRLMRKGGRIYFDPGSVKNVSDGLDIPTQIVRSPKGQNKERFTLASRAFVPKDLTKFSKTFFADAPTPTTADQPLDPGEVRGDLLNFLQAKVLDGIITATQRDTAMAKFDDATNTLIIPDANLRAALISLTGTFAEQAIATILDGANVSGKRYTIVAFADTRDFATIADTQITDSGRLRIRVKPVFQGESFQALSAILAHEALHQDFSNGLAEEQIASTVESTVWAQQLDVDPAPASTGTALTAEENIKLLALLNSGQTLFPIVGPLEAPILHDAQGVFPGGKQISESAGGPYVSYENYLRRNYLARGAIIQDTVGNNTLRTYLGNFSSAIVSNTFDDVTVNNLDANLWPVLTNGMAIRVAGALGLTVVN